MKKYPQKIEKGLGLPIYEFKPILFQYRNNSDRIILSATFRELDKVCSETQKQQIKRSVITHRGPRNNKPLVVNVVVVGPFEEEGEGTSVASDVVKVQCEDPDTPGYLRGDRVRLGRWRSRIVGASPLACSQ